MKNIVFFTGAGMSKESGLPTFRGKDGNWEKIDPNTVAYKDSWYCGRFSDSKKRRQAVLDFFNPIRRAIIANSPNEGHKLIASLEEEYNITIITQNGDDYHTRAGSQNVIYLHGEALKNSSSLDSSKSFPIDRNNPDIKIGDKAPDKSQLRPYVIFFGENIDDNLWKQAVKATENADYFVVIGCSLLVYPAINILEHIPVNCSCYTINPEDVKMPEGVNSSYTHIKEGASKGMNTLIKLLHE